MVDVFISYSRANQAEVARLAEAVAAEGYSVWWDAELPAHRPYGDVITEQIGGAKAAIVVWSQSAAASEWVRAEADVARQQKKLIQTSIEDVMPPMPFNQIQFAAIGDWRGEPDHPGWRKVKASLTALCGPRDATDRPPMPIPAAPPPRAPPASAPAMGGGTGRSLLVPALIVLALLVAGLSYLLLRPDSREEDRKEVVIAGQEKVAARFSLAAMIEDPDGFTNVRAEPSADSAIIDRVEEEEAFTTYRQTGDWWQVRTADGNVGYMSSSRIRILNRPRDAAPAEEPDDPPDRTAASAPSAAPAADPMPSTAREIFPDSDTRKLAPAELAGLSRTELSLARNEIFARRGRIFRNAALRRHFEQFPWYEPERGEVQLNAIEAANVQLIRQAEEGIKS